MSSRARYVGVLLLLTACESAPRWTKPNTTMDDLNRDSFECEQEAEKTYHMPNPFAQKSRTVFVTRCLQTKGWMEVK